MVKAVDTLIEISKVVEDHFEADSFKTAVKLAKKGKGFKLGFSDKNGKRFFGDSQFKYQGDVWQIYPDDKIQGYAATNKKTNKSRRFNKVGFFEPEFKEMEII